MTRLLWAVLVLRLDPADGHEQGGVRRVLVVSREPFHRSGMVTVCPITAARSEPRYPGEIQVPAGQAGQTRPAVILCQQVRTVSLARRQEGADQPVGYLTDPAIRQAIRRALAHHLGLDIPPVGDGALAA